MDSKLVLDGDEFFLEHDISHFCKFGLSQEIDISQQFRGGYVEVKIPRQRLMGGNAVVRFANSSTQVATFCLMPQAFETRRARSFGVAIMEYLSCSKGSEAERTSVPATTCPNNIVLDKEEWGDCRIAENVGSHVMVAVATCGEPDRIGRRVVSVWDCLTAKNGTLLILLSKRIENPSRKPPVYGEFVVDRGANIAKVVRDATTS